MRLLPILVILMIVFMAYKEVFADNAYNTAGKEKSNQNIAGMIGTATGGAMAAYFCSQPPPLTGMNLMMCITSLGGAAESLLTKKNAAGNTDPSRTPLTPDEKSVCEANPGLCDRYTDDDPLPPPYVTALDDLRKYGPPHGLNIDDPKSVDKFLSDHAGDIAGMDQAMGKLSPSQLAKIEQIKKDVASKFNVSSVALEEGGGGGGFGGRGGRGESLDLSKLMDGLNKNDRGPASLDGLQRKLAGGEAVGVAADDIFKIVSRRYQSKIQSKTFLYKK